MSTGNCRLPDLNKPAVCSDSTYGSTSAGSINISSFIQAGFLALRLVLCSSVILFMLMGNRLLSLQHVQQARTELICVSGDSQALQDLPTTLGGCWAMAQGSGWHNPCWLHSSIGWCNCNSACKQPEHVNVISPCITAALHQGLRVMRAAGTEECAKAYGRPARLFSLLRHCRVVLRPAGSLERC